MTHCIITGSAHTANSLLCAYYPIPALSLVAPTQQTLFSVLQEAVDLDEENDTSAATASEAAAVEEGAEATESIDGAGVEDEQCIVCEEEVPTLPSPSQLFLDRPNSPLTVLTLP